MGDVYMLNGKILSGLPNHAKDIEFDNTGSPLISTNTEDAIKEVNSNLTANNLVSPVDITSYNDVNNKYTFPTDGYLSLSSRADTGNFLASYLYGADEAVRLSVIALYDVTIISVKKGMTTYVYNNVGTGNLARFYGVVS